MMNKHERTKKVYVYLSEEELKMAKELAERNHISVSPMLRMMIRTFSNDKKLEESFFNIVLWPKAED